VNLVLSIQTYQEAIHSQSYATILESVVESKEREEIYYFWRNDKILLERNKYIGQIYQDFIDKPSDQNFFRGIVANFLLESLYFYNGFAFFDTLVDHMKMLATGRMIAYIRRDELTHVTIFANLIREIRKEFPDLYDETLIKKMMKTAVDQEIEWSKHILGNKIPGINGETTEGYTKWLANNRLAMLNIDPLYPEAIENPYKHLDRLQDTNSDKGNFFETTVVNYTQSSSLNGSWDF
jgi:ribonucleoside-diphosphate reductase beta chain